jgi:hypothetical protein
MIINQPSLHRLPQQLICLLGAMLTSVLITGAGAWANDVDSSESAKAVEQLKEFLEANGENLQAQQFTKTPLTKADAATAKQLLWQKRMEEIKKDTSDEIKNKAIKYNELVLKFDFTTFGEKPDDGHSLYISLHGGGGAPARVNTRQWENQKRLYKPKEGIYLAPRAPTDTWNLWHQSHIDPMFDRLVQGMVAHHGVNPNRVYVMGYSAGGDGVYQIGPRMADRWAAAAMMAGHPNDASPLSLRNIGFALHVGGRDGAYDRNKKAEQWKKLLDDLHANDPDGYKTQVKVHADKGHWMDLEDAVAVEWMAKFTRDPNPEKIVWKQDDVTQGQFYWLAVDKENEKAGTEIRATRKGQSIELTSTDVSRCTVFVSDQNFDLDQPVTVTFNGKEAFSGNVQRTIAVLDKTMRARDDVNFIYGASIAVENPQ